MNFVETLGYFYYLWLVRSGSGEKGFLGVGRVNGRVAGKAVVVGLVGCTATFWKTVLYWLIEILGGYKNIGHNDFTTLFWFWIMTNGPWLVLPLYGIHKFGSEIIEALSGEEANGVKAE